MIGVDSIEPNTPPLDNREGAAGELVDRELPPARACRSRRFLLDFQRWCIRLDAVHPDHQSAANRRSWACTRPRDRPVAENGQVVIRPVNYSRSPTITAFVDGREAVLSLVAIKEALEDPAAAVARPMRNVDRDSRA